MLNAATTELIAKRFRALGEPMRLRILQALEAGEKPVNNIVKLLDSSQPNISKHLKALCHEGLVDRRRDGLNICYRIADPAIFELCALVCRSATERVRSQLAELDALPGQTPKSTNGFHRRRR
jgi:DNA-binding transcriptional ArsR family regulator